MSLLTKFKRSSGKLGEVVAVGTTFGAMIAVPYIAATVALNGLLAGGYAIQETVERNFFGAKTKRQFATFESVRDIALPTNHGKFLEGTFKLDDGSRLKVLDVPVITEGKYWQGMQELEIGQRYDLTAYGSDTVGHRFVEASQ